LTPPECDLDADCQANCQGSANLDATCSPPSISIAGGLDADFAATLKAQLPAVLEVAARAELAVGVAGNIVTRFQAVASAAGSAGAGCVAAAADLSAKIAGVVDASASVTASVSVSASVSGEASAGG
jgi:hypothetical protein